MSKENSTFGNVEIEKNRFHRNNTPLLNHFEFKFD